MDDNLAKVKKLIKLMKKEGILSLKQGDIELSLHPSALDQQGPDLSDAPTEAEPTQYTEDQILNWSSPGYIPEEAKQ